MATVHLGRLRGPVGFSRTVAIKRLHAQFAADPEFVSMFLDEARLAARIRHPNVIPTLDVVATDGELFLVMDYVPGEALARLTGTPEHHAVPARVLSAVMAGVLHGLHAAHEAKDEHGVPLGIVHRDISPQNVLIGTDGIARLLDFGVAKAAGRVQTTLEGQIKGKLSYMPPEQLRGSPVSRQSDIYAAGIVLWEIIAGERLFSGDNEGVVVGKVLRGVIEPPSVVRMRNAGDRVTDDPATQHALQGLDAMVLKALAMDPAARFSSAREMAVVLERALPPGTSSEVAEWVEAIAGDVLHTRAAVVSAIESSASLQSEPREGHVQSVLQAKLSLEAEPSGRRSVPPSPDGTHVLSQDGYGRPITNPSARSAAMPAFPMPIATQPSSISVGTGSGYAPAAGVPKRAGAARIVVGALVGLLIGLLALAYRGYLLPPRPAEPRAPATASTSIPSAAPNESAAPKASSFAAPSAEAAAPSATASAPPSNPTVVVPPKPSPRTPRWSPPKASPDCSAPSWFDAQGVKHYKPECLGQLK
jgi:serine/threonine-protein kinase